MNSFALSDKGIVRRQNQDAFNTFRDESSGADVLIVCDGMGGAKAGNVASELAVKVFSEELKKLFAAGGGWPVREMMRFALATANSAVYELSIKNTDCSGMGTTMVAAVILNDNATILNVGDSRAYHISHGEIKQITRDHSVVEDMIRRGDITREQSLSHPSKHLITRAVGTAPTVDSDFFEVDIAAGDSLIMCSDGLSNLLTEQELEYGVLLCTTPEESCKKLIEIALSRGAPDNVTVVVAEKK